MTATLERPTTADRIRAALWFAERGFGVFSVWSANEDGSCRCPKGAACDNPGKHPITPKGFHDATTDPDRIRTLLSAGSEPNYGLVCPDGVFALDVDGDGLERLQQLEALMGELPPTLRTATAHGEHVFLRWPDELPRPIGQLWGFVTRWGSGANAGYVIGPRSVHASGAQYQPAGDTFEIATLPDEWAGSILEPAAPAATITVTAGSYELPERVPAGESRYEAIRTYTAHLYNRGLEPEEMWPLVRDRLVPRFELALPEHDVRARFERTVAGLERRLGEPRTVRGQPARVEEPQGPLEVAPLTDFVSTPIEWLWHPWLARGVVTLFDGNPGVSKSTVMADLIARITTGREWPDGSPMPAGSKRVLYVTTEDDPGRVLRPRIEAAGGDAAQVLFVKSEVIFPSGAGVFADLVARLAREPAGLALVLLDPLFSHLDASVRTISDNEMRKGVMDPLGDIAEQHGVALLVVRHFNKDTKASALNRGAGSLGGIVGAARALWTATIDPDDESGETKAVGVEKLNYAKPALPLLYRVVDRIPPGWLTGSVSGIEWIGPAPVSISTMLNEDSSTGDAMPILAAYLREKGGFSPVVAVYGHMKQRGFGRDAVRGAAKRLHLRKTKVGMSGGWTWSFPEEAEVTDGRQIEVTDQAVSSAPSQSVPSLRASRARAGGARSPVPSDSSGDSDAEADSYDAAGESVVREPSRQFELTEGTGGGGLPARTRGRAREAPAPTVVEVTQSTWAQPCHWYDDHRSRHRWTAAGWTCDACHPQEEETDA